MTAPNRNTSWGRAIVDELAKAGVTAACLTPGSRCTPLTVAFAEHPAVTTFSHLDERSAAYFALGRAKRTGEPTPLACTSGTAAANFYPAVIEANQARVPMVLLTADRPPELHDSGANQTIDQEGLYGNAVRTYRTLPEPAVSPRTLRSLRTTVSRAVLTSTGTPPGPVHLNVPFHKPLEPTPVEGDVPTGFADRHPLAAEGREGPYIRSTQGSAALTTSDRDRLIETVAAADRGLIVAGPVGVGRSADDGRPRSSPPGHGPLVDLARATGFPVLADPLSGMRFGPHVDDAVELICGGYDSYLDPRITDGWPEPDLVIRFGASPTSKILRQYLRDTGARQFLVDPAGEWRESTFAATDRLVADPARVAHTIAEAIESRCEGTWIDRFADAEATYWDLVTTDQDFEGGVIRDAVEAAPDPATVVVSNSMPVRDLDRFGQPRDASLTVLGNRGASGIDGITSTALGAGSASDDPLVLVTGDLAYYHDSNGLLAVQRCDVDATVVLINNDGGGIFHALPIEDHDTFDAFFRTPHGLDFEPTGELYDVGFARATTREEFRPLYRDSVTNEGSHVIEFAVDAEGSHRLREDLHDRVCEALG